MNKTPGAWIGQCVKSQDPPITRSCSLPGSAWPVSARETSHSSVDWRWPGAMQGITRVCSVPGLSPSPHTKHCLLLVTCTFNVQLNWTESVCYVHKRFRQFLAIGTYKKRLSVCPSVKRSFNATNAVAEVVLDMSNNFISRSKTFINRSYNRITDKINIFYDQF